jgi:ribonuclease T1
MRRLLAVVMWAAFAAASLPSADTLAREHPSTSKREIAVASLPREAQETLAAIKRGGPFASNRDGVVFGNYERRLPARQRGYYREYTVSTPGAKNRGARRIVAGERSEYYYSDDHYRTFRRIRE